MREYPSSTSVMASHDSRPQSRTLVPPSSGRLLRALSLDPGGTTGYAICDINNVNSVSIAWDQATMNPAELTELLEAVNPDEIICEDFEYRNRARAGLDLTPPKLIGVVQLYCSKGCPLHMQKAAVGKGHYSDRRLKTQGMYRRGTPHGRDALRHLLHWLTFKGGGKYIDLLSVDINLVDINVLFNGSLGGNSS